MDWHQRIIVDPKILVGKPVIKGTRISVEFVIDLLGRGWTTEQILQEYDHLTLEDIQACLAYASEILKSERVYLLPKIEALESRSDWAGNFAVVTDDRIRIRPLPAVPSTPEDS